MKQIFEIKPMGMFKVHLAGNKEWLFKCDTTTPLQLYILFISFSRAVFYLVH
jgi:hypothetical protein